MLPDPAFQSLKRSAVALPNSKVRSSVGSGLRSGGPAELVISGPVEVLQQQNQFVVLVCQAGPRLRVLSDAASQFGSGAAAAVGRFQDAGAKVLGDEPQFVSGEAADKTSRFSTKRTVGRGYKCGDQILTIGNH